MQKCLITVNVLTKDAISLSIQINLPYTYKMPAFRHVCML